MGGKMDKTKRMIVSAMAVGLGFVIGYFAGFLGLCVVQMLLE